MKAGHALIVLLALVGAAKIARGESPPSVEAPAAETPVRQFDVVVVGATPSGIMASIAAARAGRTVMLLERTNHIGGLVSGGLCKTDCFTPGATAGLFRDFRRRIAKYYTDKYGEDSRQVKICRGGLHFEPHVGELLFLEMLADHKDRLTVEKMRQFDADPANVRKEGSRLVEISILNRETKQTERYAGKVFIDATYEGDLAAAAGAPFRVGRESRDEFNEPTAGRIYQPWHGKNEPGSTGIGDNAVQAYNYRLTMTRDPADRAPIEKPASYNREDYASLAEDILANHMTGKISDEPEIDGLGRVTRPVAVPNGKFDTNNQHLAFVSTDLPEENWPWPTSSWEWRDRFAGRLRDYTLGLIWFTQHDAALPEEFRRRCLEWGRSKSEFADNDHFPYAVYVREARRVEGDYFFTFHDATSKRGSREHAASVTGWHYNADSHAVRKREPGHGNLDGFNIRSTSPCSMPYGMIVPKKVDGLLVPVAASCSHVGFLVVRMEPCWMALGEAAGTAAALAIEDKTTPRTIDVFKLQRRLLAGGSVLVYFNDAKPEDPHFEALQFFALRGFYGAKEMKAGLKEPVSEATAAKWIGWSGAERPANITPTKSTRGEMLSALYEAVLRFPPEKIAAIQAPAGAKLGADPKMADKR